MYIYVWEFPTPASKPWRAWAILSCQASHKHMLQKHDAGMQGFTQTCLVGSSAIKRMYRATALNIRRLLLILFWPCNIFLNKNIIYTIRITWLKTSLNVKNTCHYSCHECTLRWHRLSEKNNNWAHILKPTDYRMKMYNCVFKGRSRKKHRHCFQDHVASSLVSRPVAFPVAYFNRKRVLNLSALGESILDSRRSTKFALVSRRGTYLNFYAN